MWWYVGVVVCGCGGTWMWWYVGVDVEFDL